MERTLTNSRVERKWSWLSQERSNSRRRHRLTARLVVANPDFARPEPGLTRTNVGYSLFCVNFTRIRAPHCFISTNFRYRCQQHFAPLVIYSHLNDFLRTYRHCKYELCTRVNAGYVNNVLESTNNAWPKLIAPLFYNELCHQLQLELSIALCILISRARSNVELATPRCSCIECCGR